MMDNTGTVFEQAGCTGTLCDQPLDGSAEVTLRADELMAPASSGTRSA